MTGSYRSSCPVCRKTVRLSNTGNAVAHVDKTFRACPMSGQPMGNQP